MFLVGIFAAGYPTGLNNVDSSFGGQLIGMMAFLPLGFFPGYVAPWVLKKLNLLRVPPEVELEGLDMAEFQQDFFPEFERVARGHRRARTVRRSSRRRSCSKASHKSLMDIDPVRGCPARPKERRPQ